MAQVGEERPGHGRAVGQEALLLMDFKGTGREAVNQMLRLQPVQSKEECLSELCFGTNGFVGEKYPSIWKVSYKFGTSPQGKATDVYSRVSSFRVNLKLPRWIKAPSRRIQREGRECNVYL